MKRVFVVAAATALAASAGVAGAEGTRGRVVFVPYKVLDGHVLTIHGGEGGVSHTSVTLRPDAGEATVSLVIRDKSGLPVKGFVSQGENALGSFCGATTRPIGILPGRTVRVQIFTGACGDDVGVSSNGGVTATFR